MTDELPTQLNIADWFLDARVREGGGERTALITDARRLTYREVQALEIAIANLREQERALGARLAEDRRRAELLEKAKKPLPDGYKEDVLRTEADRKVIEDEIKRRYDDIASIRARYDALKKRYILLRQEAAMVEPASATAPAPAKK